MLAELTIIPVGETVDPSLIHADVLEIVADSGLPYKTTPTATYLEGSWDEVMPVVKACRDRALQHAPHTLTFVKIEDDTLVRNDLPDEETTARPRFAGFGDLIRLRPLALA